MKKSLFAFALALTATAWAADPIAVWDGADEDYNFSHDTNGGFSIAITNGNTIASDGITIVGTSGGVVFTNATAALDQSTIIIRGTGLDLAHGDNQYLLTFRPSDAGLASGSNVQGYPNYVGVSLSTNNAHVAGIWKNAYYDTATGTQTAFTSGDEFAIRYYKSGDNTTYKGTYVWEFVTDDSGNKSLAERYVSDGLRGADPTYYGFSLGGTNGTTCTNLDPATGWKITKIAVFNSVLTTDEILAYAFPSEYRQTITLTETTTVSAINALTSATTTELKLVVSDGVTITNDVDFSASTVTVTSTGSVTFQESDNYTISETEIAKLDVSDVAGSVVRSWYTPGVIGVNFNKNATTGGVSYGTADDTSGALVSTTDWYGTTSASGSTTITSDGLTTVTWSSGSMGITSTDFTNGTFMQGYLNDGRGVTINVTGIPYATYDVIVYNAANTTGSFTARVINGTAYIWDDATSAATSGDAVTSTSTWGSSSTAVGAAILGTNAIRVNGLSGALSITGAKKSDTERGCIAAFEIMPANTTSDAWTLDLAANASADWTTASWQGGDGSTYPSADAVTITLAGDATLTVDSALDLPLMTLTGTGTLTIVEGASGNATIAKIISTGPSISATSLTVKDTLTAAITVPADGLTLTVPADYALVQTGIISGSGALTKAGDGTLTVSSANTFTGGLVVSAGTMKTTSATGYGPYASDSQSTITIGTGATLDLANTFGSSSYNITSAGTIYYSGAYTFSTPQVTSVTLSGDSVIGGAGNYGFIGASYAATSLNLGSSTLVKTNSNILYLYDTTVTGNSGTIRIDEGTISLIGYNSSCAFDGATVDIGSEGTLIVSDASVSGLSVTGSGTLNIGQVRPTNAINFEDGNNVTLSVTILSGTETSLKIPYTGAQPANVELLVSGGAADVSLEVSYDTEGYITLTSTYSAPLTFNNPVTDAEQTFTYAFTNKVVGYETDWDQTGNWYEVVSSRYVAFSGERAPAVTNMWTSALAFDGKTVTGTLEGYNMRFGFFNGSTATLSLNKLQSPGTAYIWIDDTSKMIVTSIPSNTAGTLPLYIAAADGLEFTEAQTISGTITYNLKGDGSVKYASTLSGGTHSIGTLVLDAYTEQQSTSLPYGIVKKHPLVTFGAESSVTPDTSSTVVYFNNTYGSTQGTAWDGEEDMTKQDATKANCGKYKIYSDTTGIYIDYIGYAEDAISRGYVISVQ